MQVIVAGLLILIVTIPFILGMAILRAFVLKTLWGWFIVPVFNLPPLGMAAAFGISLTISTFLPSSPTSSSDDKDVSKETKIGRFFVNLSVPLFTLLIGWIAHQFM